MHVNALLKTLADRVAVVKAKKFSDALEHVQPPDLPTNLQPRMNRCKPRQSVADITMWLARHWWKGLADTITEVRVRMMPTD